MTARPLFRPRAHAPWLALLLAAGLWASPALAQTRSADFIVAVVNSEPITNNDVRLRVARVQQQMSADRVAIPPRDELAQRVLERLILERAQLQLGRQAGIKVDDAAVDEAEQGVARQNGIDVAALRRRLAAEGTSSTAFRQELQSQLMIVRVREREVDSRVRVSEQEIDQFLREQQAAEPGEVELNLAQVLIAVPENVTAPQLEALAAKARRVQMRAQAGEDFAQLVREFSDAGDAASTGGVFGLRAAERYPTLFLEATASLPVGGVSEVVRSGAGYHVLKVLEKKQSGGMTVVQSRARHILLRPSPQLTESAARQRLAEFRRRLLTGLADFADLAREHSQDGSAASGGDLGWAGPGLFVPEFEDIMNSLAPGELSEPFASRFGVHLMQLVERRRGTLSVREQREMARNQLRQKKADEAYAQWIQEVRGRAFVDLREPPQ